MSGGQRQIFPFLCKPVIGKCYRYEVYTTINWFKDVLKVQRYFSWHQLIFVASLKLKDLPQMITLGLIIIKVFYFGIKKFPNTLKKTDKNPGIFTQFTVALITEDFQVNGLKKQ